jgi:hypothetical protein
VRPGQAPQHGEALRLPRLPRHAVRTEAPCAPKSSTPPRVSWVLVLTVDLFLHPREFFLATDDSAVAADRDFVHPRSASPYRTVRLETPLFLREHKTIVDEWTPMIVAAPLRLHEPLLSSPKLWPSNTEYVEGFKVGLERE